MMEVVHAIAFVSNLDGNYGIFIRDLGNPGSGDRRVTPAGDYADSEPDFAPGNKTIVFTRWKDGDSELWTVGIKGHPLKQLTSFGAMVMHPAYSPDGSRIAFISDQDGQQDVYVMNADGSNVQRITNTTYHDSHPTWSPDGQWLAYASADYEPYPIGTHIRARNLVTGSNIVVTECPDNWCDYPVWSRTDKRIIYLESDHWGQPPALKLIDLDLGTHITLPDYPSGYVGAWKPDGTRFVYVTAGTQELLLADTENISSGQVYPLPSPGGTQVGWPTWSR